ncbi:hypothetical protein BC827DRAFT_560894 [Russula dissimulans]|nr:hypothetical protein BC827DRAFT_560894 [Russula dissimulans]
MMVYGHRQEVRRREREQKVQRGGAARTGPSVYHRHSHVYRRGAGRPERPHDKRSRCRHPRARDDPRLHNRPSMRALLRDEQRDVLPERERGPVSRAIGRLSMPLAGHNMELPCAATSVYNNDNNQTSHRSCQRQGREKAAGTHLSAIQYDAAVSSGSSGWHCRRRRCELRAEGPGVPGAISFCVRFVALKPTGRTCEEHIVRDDNLSVEQRI